MRKALAIFILIFCGLVAHGQSLSMSDLTNLATFNIDDANNFLAIGRPFKQKYMQDIDGRTLHHYQGNTPASKSETVVVGDGFVTGSGTLLHKISYTSTQIKYVTTLMEQAHAFGLNRIFKGSDKFNNIFVYTNSLYTVRIFVKNDNSEGTIEVKQNDFVRY